MKAGNFTKNKRSSRPNVFCQKGVLRNFAEFTGKHLCQGLSKACNFIKIEILTHVFSCKFCKISKNTFSYRAPPVTAFKWTLTQSWLFICCITKLKKKIFLKKYLWFLQNIHYLQKKMFSYGKKDLKWKSFLLKKTFLQRKI